MVADPTRPIGDAEFAAALDGLARFETRPFVAVATSGGPDSLALTILADRWARARGGEIRALSVDHRLRPESGSEILRLAQWLRQRGIGHDVLVWTGAKPPTGIEEAARMARYALLAGWCRAHGCLHLLLAHHREDQIETHLIRRRAGSGPDGLAGMSAIREIEGCRLLRPLLGFPKARLAALLMAERQPWIVDPSNDDPAFERARLRRERRHRIGPQSLAAAPVSPSSPPAGATGLGKVPPRSPSPLMGEGRDGGDAAQGRQVPRGGTASPMTCCPPLSAPGGGEGNAAEEERLCAEIRMRGDARIARERARARLLAGAVALHPAGFAVVDGGCLAAMPEAAAGALAALAMTIGGGRYPPRRAGVARLMAALAAGERRGHALGGCRFVRWRGGVLVLRELARAADPIRLTPGTGRCWDRRFRVDLPQAAPGPVAISYLGPAGAAELARRIGRRRLPPLPRLAFPVLPAARDEHGLLCVPALGWRRAEVPVPTFSFRPANPLTTAGFTVV